MRKTVLTVLLILLLCLLACLAACGTGRNAGTDENTAVSETPGTEPEGENSGQQGQSAEESGEVETMTEASGPAGGRMAAWLGSYGPAAFGGDDLPRPGAVIMQYTGHSEYTEYDPPTYACVGESDGIASWRTMEQRIEALKALGIPTEFHHYPGLRHGFGLGTGTVAEGWIDGAVAFWEAQM